MWNSDFTSGVARLMERLHLYYSKALWPAGARKPSSSRLPHQGVFVSTDGQEHVLSVIGLMTRNLGLLMAVTKSGISARPWEQDPSAARCNGDRKDEKMRVRSR